MKLKKLILVLCLTVFALGLASANVLADSSLYLNYFPSEKILQQSIQTYCASRGKKITDYNSVDVYVLREQDNLRFFYSIPTEDFAGKWGGDTPTSIPKNTEIIVNYKLTFEPIYSNNQLSAVLTFESGTALIPKNPTIKK